MELWTQKAYSDSNVKQFEYDLLRMVVDGGVGDGGEWAGRWNHIQKFLERPGPFTHPDFEASTEVMVYAKLFYENCF